MKAREVKRAKLVAKYAAKRQALKEAQTVNYRPTLIIGNTLMGKGARGEDQSSY